ncbi:MAG: UDP-glucose 4-epimerase GalE, partial [Rhizobiaceae bacterium]
GHGYSVLEVVDSVQRVHGAELNVEMAGRRPGDPPSIVANSELAQRELGWTPARNDLDLIVGDALRWEEALSRRNSI